MNIFLSPGQCMFWSALTPALSQSNFIIFTVDSHIFVVSVFLQCFLFSLFIYLEERASCNFSAVARSGLSNQLRIWGRVIGTPRMWRSWARGTQEQALLFSWWGLLCHALCSLFHTSKSPKQVVWTMGGSGMFFSLFRAFSLKVGKHQWLVLPNNRI